MLKSFFLLAYRNIVKNKFYVLVNILGLGATLACCIVAYLNHRFEADYNKTHQNLEKIYKVNIFREVNDRQQRYGISPASLAPALGSSVSGVESVIRFTTNQLSIKAGRIALIPTIVTVFVAIVVTSYITSYGLSNGYFSLPANGVGRLSGYFITAEKITGTFGLIVLCVFTLLSAMTTLLGSYFYLGQLFNNSENQNIKIYLGIITIAGTLAIFGFNIIFDIVDLLLFVVASLNMLALSVFIRNRWKDYSILDMDNEVIPEVISLQDRMLTDL